MRRTFRSRIDVKAIASGLPGMWLLAAAFLLLINAPYIALFQPHDPDDWMRLLQVRDWLAGQQWYDSHQYRMAPAATGADIHWVRLGDLPLAAVLWPLQMFLPARAAEITAMTITPLILLLGALALVRALMIRLKATSAETTIALALFALLPLVITNFKPLRVDYHNLQAMAALAMVALLVGGNRRQGVLAGLVGAFWLTLSLEGLAFVCGAVAILSLYHLRFRRPMHEPFLAGLAIGSVFLTLVFRPLAEFGKPYCDVLSSPHLAAFAAAAVVAFGTRKVLGDDRFQTRVVALVLSGAAAGGLIVVPLGACSVSPLIHVDAIARANYFDIFLEAAPIHKQPLSLIVMTLWTLVVTLAGTWVMTRSQDDAQLRARWVQLCCFTLLGIGVSLLVIRAGIVAQALSVPMSAALLAKYLPPARAVAKAGPRIAATLATLGLATPILPTALATPLNGETALEREVQPFVKTEEDCDFDRLNVLPLGSQIFMTISETPEMLARTNHRAIAGTYHRSGPEIADVFRVFAGPRPYARSILHRYGAEYVVYCRSSTEFGMLAARGPQGIARDLANDHPPAWLTPVPGFEQGVLRVYEVR